MAAMPQKSTKGARDLANTLLCCAFLWHPYFWTKVDELLPRTWTDGLLFYAFLIELLLRGRREATLQYATLRVSPAESPI